MSKALTTSVPVEVTGITPAEQAILTEILKDIQVSVDRMAKAAAKWVGLSEKTRRRIVEQTNPSFRNFWQKLDRVGRGELHPLLVTVAGTAAAMLGKMPLEDQDKYLHELIPVVFRSRRGWDSRLVDVADMTEDQRKQVFKMAKDGTVSVRDEEAQRAWIADRDAKNEIAAQAAESLRKVERNGWKVERGRVFVKQSALETGLTRKQVEQMLRDLEE